MRATRLVLGTLALCAAAYSSGSRGAQAASPGEPAVAGQKAQRSYSSPSGPAPAEKPVRPASGAGAAAPATRQQEKPPPAPPAAAAGQPAGQGRPAPGAPGAGEPAAKPPPDAPAAASAEGRGTLVYQGPAIPRSEEQQKAAQEQDQAEREEREEREDVRERAEREREERDDEISGLQAQIDELRGRMEAEPSGSAEGAPHLQQLEAQLSEMQERVRRAEVARLERIAGYCDLWRRLRDVQQEVAYGEWEARETLSWADWLLRVYFDEAQRMGALVETASIEEALDGLQATRAALEQEDLFKARVDLALVLAALERARKAAELATSPANEVLGR